MNNHRTTRRKNTNECTGLQVANERRTEERKRFQALFSPFESYPPGSRTTSTGQVQSRPAISSRRQIAITIPQKCATTSSNPGLKTDQGSSVIAKETQPTPQNTHPGAPSSQPSHQTRPTPARPLAARKEPLGIIVEKHTGKQRQHHFSHA
jgi:hypothetical protein